MLMAEIGDDTDKDDVVPADIPANPHCSACNGHGIVVMLLDSRTEYRHCPACYPTRYPDDVTIH